MKRFKPLVFVFLAGVAVCSLTVVVLAAADPCYVQEIDHPTHEVDIPGTGSGSGGVKDTGSPAAATAGTGP